MNKLIPRYKNGSSVENDLTNTLSTLWNSAKEYLTPTEAITVAAKTALTLLDPTGISSWGDAVLSGLEFINDPTLANFGWAVLDVLSAVPVLGRAAAPGKVIKAARKIAKATGKASKGVIKKRTKKLLYDTKGLRLNDKIDTVLEEFFPFMNRPTRAVLDWTTTHISTPLYLTLSTNPIFRKTPFNPQGVPSYRNFDSLVGYFNFGKTLAGLPHDFYDYFNRNNGSSRNKTN